MAGGGRGGHQDTPTSWTRCKTQAQEAGTPGTIWMLSGSLHRRTRREPRPRPRDSRGPRPPRRPESHAHRLATPRATPSSWAFPELRTVGQSAVGPAHQGHAHPKPRPGHAPSLTVPALRPQPRSPLRESLSAAQTLLRPHPFLHCWRRRGPAAPLTTAATACIPAAGAARGQSRPRCTLWAGEPARAHATGVKSRSLLPGPPGFPIH